VWDVDPDLPVATFVVPATLLWFLGVALVLLLGVAGWKYTQTRAQRTHGGHTYQEIR
jgi:hypothetical protein